jgi:hypothetical protein
LPAVTRPCGRNGVRSVASFSSAVSGRGASSAVARPQPASGSRVATVTRSGCSLPAAYAAAVFRWDARPNRSARSRVISG